MLSRVSTFLEAIYENVFGTLHSVYEYRTSTSEKFSLLPPTTSTHQQSKTHFSNITLLVMNFL